MTQLTKLTKEFTQDRKGYPNMKESTLILTVMYDGETVDHVKQVEVHDAHSGRFIDVTAIFLEHFEDQLNAMVDTIDWSDEYSMYQKAEADYLQERADREHGYEGLNQMYADQMKEIKKALRI